MGKQYFRERFEDEFSCYFCESGLLDTILSSKPSTYFKLFRRFVGAWPIHEHKRSSLCDGYQEKFHRRRWRFT